MKKNKQKAQLKANRKQSVKAIKATLINDLINLISTFAEPNKKLKKLIEKSATSFAKEIEKTAKPVIETADESVLDVVENKIVTSKATKLKSAKKPSQTAQK